ncbi:MAG TPA: YceI family protein [Anaeromyxobacter sp.]
MAATLLALLLAAASSEGKTYAVDPATSTVRYHVVHKFHSVTGTSSTIEGKAVLRPDGQAIAMVRIPMASFDSGDRNRDSNMREAVDAARHPFVVLKGAMRLGAELPAAARALTVETRMEGEVELHGVRKSVVVPLQIQLSPDGTARARGSFTVSLDAFGIERPSLLFVKIDDACRIEVDLALREGKS